MPARKWICGKCNHENCSCRNTCKNCGDNRGNNRGWVYISDGKIVRKVKKR